MIICFMVTNGGDTDAAEKALLEQAKLKGFEGIKVHRSVGTIRASN
jgi:phosphoserine aminotransferase